MFSILKEDGRFKCLCNESSIVSHIPTEEIANQLIERLKALDWIDWAKFPKDIYITESLAIDEAIENLKRSIK